VSLIKVTDRGFQLDGMGVRVKPDRGSQRVMCLERATPSALLD
jgi:hypothetical protein